MCTNFSKVHQIAQLLSYIGLESQHMEDKGRVRRMQIWGQTGLPGQILSKESSKHQGSPSLRGTKYTIWPSLWRRHHYYPQVHQIVDFHKTWLSYQTWLVFSGDLFPPLWHAGSYTRHPENERLSVWAPASRWPSGVGELLSNGDGTDPVSECCLNTVAVNVVLEAVLFQRTQVWFPAPTLDDFLLRITAAPGDRKLSSGFSGHLYPRAHTHTHTHTKLNNTTKLAKIKIQ